MKTRAQKEQTVVVLTDKLKSAKSVVFTDYKGLSMAQLSDLRNKLSETEAEFSVTKNSLLSLALKATQMDLPDSNATEGPTATLFAYQDEITPIKILVKALKDNQMGKVKAGFLNFDFLTESQINQLATLPSKGELQAKVVGSIASPLYGMVNVLQGNLRNLVYVISSIKDQKSSSA